MYNPDYIDDRELQDILREERAVQEELKWRIERELNETKELLERIRETVHSLDIMSRSHDRH